MIITNLVFFLVFLFILIKCVDYAIKYSSRLAKVLRFPEFIVSFFIIALVCCLPEATVSIISAFNGNPGLGFGVLLGAKIADLTLVLGIITLFSSNGINIKSKTLKNNFYYFGILLFPLIFGLDGKFTRIEGFIFVLFGSLFLVKIYRDRCKFRKKLDYTERRLFFKSLIFLLLSLIFLLLSAYLTVEFATNFAIDVNIPVMLIGLTIIALGTCLPELIFSIKTVRINHEDLALGDLLGSIIIDATIFLGIIILVSPFSLSLVSAYTIGISLFLAGILVLIFMKSDRSINKKEGLILILIYIAFVFMQFFVNPVL